MSTLRIGLTAFLLAACSSPSQNAPAGTPSQSGDGAPVESTPTPPAPAKGPGVGEKCADGHVCGDGLECVEYYGIAGARGPKFESCEKRCDDKTACPDGLACRTIADGPGQVCR